MADWEGLRVVDVSDPAAPTTVGTYHTPAPGRGLDVKVQGIYAYLADGPNGLRIVDASDPTMPVSVGVDREPDVSDEYWVWDVDVRDGYAFVIGDDDGEDTNLEVIDVSTPTAPEMVASYGTPCCAQDVHVLGDYAYLATSDHFADDGLWIVDVSDATAPVEVGSFQTSDEAGAVYVVGRYAYLAGDYGLHVIDVSDPRSPVRVGTHAAEWLFAADVHVRRDHAYVAAWGDGLRVVDVSDAAAPIEVGFYDTPGYANGVYAWGEYIYVADRDGRLFTLRLIPPGDWRLHLPLFLMNGK